MDPVDKCSICSTVLYEFSSRYHCCDPNYIVCIGCHFRNCPKCQSQQKWMKILPPECNICMKKLTTSEAVKEEVCGAYFCPRCVNNSFLGLYLSNSCPQIIELRCGHFVDKEKLFTSLSKSCLSCGEQLSTRASYALQDGLKLCLSCSRYEMKRFRPFILECVNCAKILMASEVNQSADVPICYTCSDSQGTIQSMIEESSAISKQQPSSLPSVHQPPPKIEQESEQDIPPSPPISIVSRFSAFDFVDEKLKSQPMSSPKLMSKNSTQIRVQDLKLPVDVAQVKTKMCGECRCFFEESQLFRNKDAKKGRICKVCCAEQDRYTQSRGQMTSQNRMGHTSAPKKKAPVEAVRPNPMKKSYMPNDEPSSSVNLGHKPTQLLPIPAATTQPQPVKFNTIVQPVSKDRLCQVCGVNRVMIIREQKRLCSGCANKAL